MEKRFLFLSVIFLAALVGLAGSPASAQFQPQIAGRQPVESQLDPIPSRTQRFQTAEGPLIIHPIQHASFVMQWNDQTIFVDPVGGLDLYKQFPKANLILLTHDHGDHLNQDVIDGVSSDFTQIIAPAPVIEKLNASSKPRAILMANGDKKTLGAVSIEALPMYNTTPERLRYHQKGKGNGYVLTLGGKRIYISGDTEDIPEMRALRNIDIAFVCMNLPYTMSVEQAADAVRDFKPKIVYPYHYRGSNLEKFKTLVGADLPIEVKIVDWYAK
ncbi:MAG: MBL fold metallo-hydrolase [Candidatus Hinthialibacter sp.]